MTKAFGRTGRWCTGRGTAAISLSALSAVVAIASAAQGGTQGAGQGGGKDGAAGNGPPKPFLTFYSAGADAYLRSPKDKWLLDAVHRLETEGVQLPPELQRNLERDPQGRVVTSILRDLLTTRLAATVAIAPAAEGGPPMPEGQLTMLGNARRPGNTIEGTLIDAVRMSGMWSEFKPDPSNASLRTFQQKEAPKVWLGTLAQGGVPATVLSIGRPPSAEPMSFERFGVPKGVEPQVALELDFGPLQPYLGMASVMLPEGPDGRGPLEQMGIVSDTPMIFRLAATNDGTDGRIEARLVNGAKAMNIPPAQRQQVLEPADLQWIPADTSGAWCARMDFPQFLTQTIDQYNAQLEAFGADDDGDFDNGGMNGEEGKGDGNAGGKGAAGEGPIDRAVREATGLDLRRDLIAPLGNFACVHSSDSLGGGLMGTVMVVTLRDSATMSRTLERLATVLHDQREPRDAGFGLRARKQPGLDALYSLSFAGLPIPLQVSIGIGNGAMAVSLSPQTTIAALAQAKAKGSLADRAEFKAMAAAAGMKGATGFAWFDAASALKGGYGALLALANAADSALLPQSGPATPFSTTVPSVAELSKGAKPSLLVGRFDGDDIAWTYLCDGSFSVQFAAFASQVMGGSITSAPLLAGLLLPAMAQARSAAQEVRREQQARAGVMVEPDDDAAAAAPRGRPPMDSANQLKMIAMATIAYTADREDRLPSSLDDLLQAEYLTQRPKNARRTPGLTGEFQFQPPVKRLSQAQNPSRMALAWEAYSRWPEGGIAVAFLDGHVAMIADEEEFEKVRPH